MNGSRASARGCTWRTSFQRTTYRSSCPESQRFNKINKFFTDRMHKCVDTPNVILQITTPGLLEAFVDANQALDEIQKQLNDFLETKCAAFPRFYL